MPKQRRTKRTILFEEFKKKILTGEMKPGELFPSARILGPSCNVSQRTATSIIRELGHLGLLKVSPGRRSVVCAPGKNPKRPRFDKPIGIISPRSDLLFVAQWRDWLVQHFQEKLTGEGYQAICVPEDIKEEDLKAYSGFVVAGEVFQAPKWEMLLNSGLPCVRLSFFRPYPNTVYVDYRLALDQVGLFLARQECRCVIMLTCCEREAKYAFNWFSEIGFMKTLQSYNVEEYGFQRIVVTPGTSKELKHLRTITSAVKEKTAFLTSSPAYTQIITELMANQKKILGADYEVISLSRAPEEPIAGGYVDLKCHEIINKMLEVLFTHQLQRKPQIGQVIAAEFYP